MVKIWKEDTFDVNIWGPKCQAPIHLFLPSGHLIG